MRFRTFFIFSLIFYFNSSFGQNIELKGKIIEVENQKPLPFATIEIKKLHIGTIANKNGEFHLITTSQNLKTDTIEFTYLGFDKKRISIFDFINLQDKTINLDVKFIDVGETIITPKKLKTIELGIKAKKPDGKQITSIYDNKIGNYIENKKKKAGWIKSVSYYIFDLGHPETPFRVRIYELDSVNKCPGKDLLTENVIAYASEPGWFTIDLSEYNIVFPKNGAFIVMEWINNGDSFMYETEAFRRNQNGEKIREKREFYGQVIGSVYRQPKLITWGITLGYDWIPYELYHKGYINAMIKTEINYEID